MKLTGYTSTEVDERVEQFSKLMRKEMAKACRLAADEVELSAKTVTSDSLLAAGEANLGIIYTAVDSLAVVFTYWKKAVAATLMPFIEKVFVDAGQRVVSPLGDISPVKTVSALESMENLVSSFSNEMWDTAKAELIAGAQDGESIAHLASRVENVANIKAKKAHVIAQTTVIAAVNGGEWRQMLEAASAFDLVTVKEWVSTHDSHTRPTHDAADGQRQPLNEAFVVGGGFLQYPGDPGGPPEEIISCRCTTVYEVDTEEPITASQTSPETLFNSSAVTDNGQKIAQSLTAAFDPSEHPRGKDGKFIKKGAGLSGGIFDALVHAKKGGLWNELSEDEKQHFVDTLEGITPTQWHNLKDEDQEHLKELANAALDDGLPGSAKALMHVEDFELVESGDEDEQHPDLFNPSTPLPASTWSTLDTDAYDVGDVIGETGKPGETGHTQLVKLTPGVTGKHDFVLQSYNKKDDNWQPLGYLTKSEIAKGEAAQEVLGDWKVNTPGIKSASYATPIAPLITPTPTLTTGSSKPIKITHGLIHAKHTPGTTIAVSTTGTHIVWNGDSYDIIGASGNKIKKNVKKSKLYALLNTDFKLAQWKSPGKQETEVTHAAPLDAAPPANPVPHPTSATPWAPIPGLGTSSVDDALDEAFGPLNTGLAPAPTVSSPSTPAVAKQMDLTGWKKIGGQGGSNKGGLYQAPNGEKFYVKSLKSEAHAKNEVLAAALYNAAGVNVPNVQHGGNHPEGWKNVVISPIVSNAVSAKSKLNVPGQFRTDAQSGFAVDAWLANYDTVGLTYDNIVDANGKPWRIDVGGSLLFRAQGGKKTDWGDDPTSSLTGLKNASKNPQATSLFGSMTSAEEKESAKKLLGITHANIDQLVKDAGLPDSMAKTLKARRNAILAKYGLDDQNSSTPSSIAPATTPIVITQLTEVPSSLPELDDKGNKQYAQALAKWQDGTLTKAQFDDLVDTIKQVHPSSSPSAPLTQADLGILPKDTNAEILNSLAKLHLVGYLSDTDYKSLKQNVESGISTLGAKTTIGQHNLDVGAPPGPAAAPSYASNPILLSPGKVGITELLVGDDDQGFTPGQINNAIAGLTQEKWNSLSSDEKDILLSYSDEFTPESESHLDLLATNFTPSATRNAAPSVAPAVSTAGLSNDQINKVAKLQQQYNKGLLTLSEFEQQIDLVKSGTPTGSVTTSSVQLALDNAYIYGLITEAQHNDLQKQFDAGDILGVDTTLNSMSSGSSSAPSTPPATPTVTAADIASPKKYQFYKYFKDEKVSPAWSGAKIYASMHAAKQKMSGDSQVAALSDAEMLKILDEQHNVLKATTGSAYGDKVKDWLKTPNGQKAFKDLNPAIPTPPTAYTGPAVAKKVAKKGVGATFAAKKAAKKAAAVPPITLLEALGTSDISVMLPSTQTHAFSEFKSSPHGKYLKEKPELIYWNAVQQTKAPILDKYTPGQILAAVDAENGKKFGGNTNAFENAVTAWLNTPAGKQKAAEIKAGTWAPPTTAKATKAPGSMFTSYGSSGGSTSYAHAASTPLADKVHSVDQNVPAWNANDTTSYPIISTSEAASLWSNMQSTHGNMTETQKKSLKHYTSNPGYVAMNRYLRGEIGASAATHAHVKNAQDGMRPTTKAITLNRGNGWFKGWENFAAIKAKEGTEFKQEAFFSASVGGKAAFGFKPIRMTIEAPEGTPMAYVKAFSNYGGENEMLLAADLSYQIISVTQSGGHVNVHMRVIAKGTGG